MSKIKRFDSTKCDGVDFFREEMTAASKLLSSIRWKNSIDRGGSRRKTKTKGEVERKQRLDRSRTESENKCKEKITHKRSVSHYPHSNKTFAGSHAQNAFLIFPKRSLFFRINGTHMNINILQH